MTNSKFAFLPQNIGIELVRGCNFDCPMCSVTTHAPFELQRFQFIDLGVLAKLIEELDRWPSVKFIWFFHMGEPMAHPSYRQCLEILYRSPVAQQALVIQYTNASLLKGDKAEAILDIPIIKKLVFSFDGFGDKESFERLRGPHFERVLDNIKWFSAQARQRRPDLRLATSTILPRAGEVPGLEIPRRDEALAQLHELFDPFGVQIEPRDMHNYSGNDTLALSGKPPVKIFGGCPFIEQDSLYFTVNGWAQPCCAVYHESFNVGQFPEQDFGQLLNNEAMNVIRHGLRLDQRADLSMCRSCCFSIGGMATPTQLATTWLKRDAADLLQDPPERGYILGTVMRALEEYEAAIEAKEVELNRLAKICAEREALISQLSAACAERESLLKSLSAET